jgi:hypothetical protein
MTFLSIFSSGPILVMDEFIREKLFSEARYQALLILPTLPIAELTTKSGQEPKTF